MYLAVKNFFNSSTLIAFRENSVNKGFWMAIRGGLLLGIVKILHEIVS